MEPDKFTEATAVDAMLASGFKERHAYLPGKGWHYKKPGQWLWRREGDAASIREEVRSRFKFIGLSTNKSVNGALTFAQGHPQFRPTSKFDLNPEIVGCPNGYLLDLATGKPHQKEAFVTKALGATPQKGIPRRFLRFLLQVLKSKADVRYFQRVCGYCLTGHTREQVFWYFYGKGSNGKGVLVKVLVAAFGSYHQRVASDKMLANPRGGDGAHLEWLAKLDGPRLVTADETRKHWYDHRLKQLVAGDQQTANYMRQDSFDFLPVFKLILVGNDMPIIQGGPTYAMERRIKIMEFANTFPAGSDDPELTDKLLAELPQILAWMIEGAKAYLRDGLLPDTDSIKAMRKEFTKGAESPLSKWARTRFEYRNGAFTPSAAIVKDAKAHGIQAARVKGAVLEALQDEAKKEKVLLAYDTDRTNGKRVYGWRGLELQAPGKVLDIDKPPFDKDDEPEQDAPEAPPPWRK